MKKILIIRFSSFGDVVQAINASRVLKHAFPRSEISWLSKKMFTEFLGAESSIDHALSLEKDFGGSIWQVCQFIMRENVDVVYDAHRNLRTFIVKFLISLMGYKGKWFHRPKSRLKRFLLFYFRINLFERPFYAKFSYLHPLKRLELEDPVLLLKKSKFNLSYETIHKSKFSFIGGPYVVFAPSAAWEMKRWPIQKWKDVINVVSKTTKVVLVGGPGDSFIEELFDNENTNVLNLSGKTNFYETFYLVDNSSYVLSADTGVIHIADLLNKRGGLLLGPTAFGRTESAMINIFETDLFCRPCTKDGRGKCSRNTYQECMTSIPTKSVINDIFNTLSE